MLKWLNSLIQKSLFKANLISFFINPSYFTRKGLYNWIKKNKQFIHWKVLDFWCWQKPYQELFSYEEYVWLDIEESWHKHSNESIDIFYDGKKIPFKNQYFDSVFTSQVFEHVADMDDTTNEIHRVLKKNGHFFLTIPLFAWEHEIPYDFRRYTSFWIRHLLEKHWFIIKKIEKKWTYMETIFQLITLYVFNLFVSCKNNIIKWILTIIFIFPLNLIWTVLSVLLPNNSNTYLNLIVLAKKA